MKNYVVESYENYCEKDRLSTDNARRIEFLTTVRILDKLISGKKHILDCAAGTGIYAFHFADKGHTVTATDLTPRHIEMIRKALEEKPYQMETAVLDAVNMEIFEDECFDVVLNMGPFYHLPNGCDRERCMKESLRVLKKGGLIVTAYISRYFVFQHIALRNSAFLDANLARQLIETGELRHDDPKCFWTDTYYSTCEEMERLYQRHGVAITDHFAQDGMTSVFAEKVNQWNAEEFKIWCDYHYSVCRERSLLGASNHVVIVGKK